MRLSKFLYNDKFRNLIVLFLAGICILYSSFGNLVYAGNISESSILELLNVERVGYGLGKLNVNEKLTAAAYMKAYDMLSKQYWSHYGPSGENPWNYILSTGYNYSYAGENLAYGFDDAFDVHNAWMNSEAHKKNMLNNGFNDVGIAVVNGYFEGKETTLVVEIFGTQSGYINSSQENIESILDKNGIKIMYPSNNSSIENSLFGVLGLQKNIENNEINVYIDGNDQGIANVSGNTFSIRVNLEEKGNHIVEAVMNSGGKLYKDSSQFTIVDQKNMLYATQLVYTKKDDTFVLSGNTNGKINVASIKTDTDVIDCSLRETYFECLLPSSIKNQSNKNLILVSEDSNVFSTNVDNIPVGKLSATTGRNTNFFYKIFLFSNESKLVVITILSLFLLVEILIFFVRKKVRYEGRTFGYNLSLVLILIFVQFLSIGGKVL